MGGDGESHMAFSLQDPSGKPAHKKRGCAIRGVHIPTAYASYSTDSRHTATYVGTETEAGAGIGHSFPDDRSQAASHRPESRMQDGNVFK